MLFRLPHLMILPALVCLAPPAFSAGDEIQIILGWTATYDRLEPRPKRTSVTWEKRLYLSGDKTIREVTNRSAGGRSKSNETTKDLGEVGGKGGGWRIVNEQTIQRVSVLLNSVRTTTIRMEGKTRCSLEVVYRLDPGQTELRLEMLSRPGVIGRYTKPVITNTSCRIVLPGSI